MRTGIGVLLSLVTVLLLVWTTSALGQTADPKIVAMSPHKLEEQELTTNVSSGLPVVPKGSVAYFRAEDMDGEPLISALWEILASPSGSSATIAGPTDSSTTFTPDTTGQYQIRLTVTTASGSDDSTFVITAGKYAGIGDIGGATPDFAKGQCAACHAGAVDDKVGDWETTGHATIFRGGIDGVVSSHYASYCIGCHTTGFDDGATATNDGFDDVMVQVGWTFPDTLQESNSVDLETNFPDLAQLGVIGCENCHGPGTEHKGAVDKTAKSLDVGVCAQCHDEPWRHNIVSMWENSTHAELIGFPATRSSCEDCHAGSGFVKGFKDPSEAEGVPFENNLTCASCHDPHSDANEHLLRTVTADSLNDGTPITLGGLGQLCMNCHKSRRDAETYAVEYHDHFGPHHSLQADMYLGANAIEFGYDIGSSTHKFAVEDGCVGCHMYATPDTGQVGRDRIGGHSFAPHWDNDTPEDPSDDVENVAACADCHGPISSFDDIIASADYDNDGTVEGVQSEIHGMLTTLALLLPPIGVDEVEVDTTFTVTQLQTAYNYFFVEEDGSFGVHNAKYAFGLLEYTIGVLTGVEPVDEETIPLTYALNQNYPNPFNPSTEIRFSLPTTSWAKIEIYSVSGRKVATLAEGRYAPGTYKVKWNGTNDAGNPAASGMYMYRIEARGEPSGGFTMTKKMVLLK